MKLKLIAGLATALMLGVSAIGHAEPICWVANGHYYEAVAFPSGITWDEARAVAANSTYLGVSGHLATITSMEENTFIVNNLVDPENQFNTIILLTISGNLWYVLLQGKPEKRGETLQYEAVEKA